MSKLFPQLFAARRHVGVHLLLIECRAADSTCASTGAFDDLRPRPLANNPAGHVQAERIGARFPTITAWLKSLKVTSSSIYPKGGGGNHTWSARWR